MVPGQHLALHTTLILLLPHPMFTVPLTQTEDIFVEVNPSPFLFYSRKSPLSLCAKRVCIVGRL